jgi:MFS family permease
MGRPERSPVRRLALARLISNVGTAAADIAAAHAIYQRTHSAYWLSALFLLTFGVNGLLNPLFGALADRHDRRRIMIASDLVGAACFAALIPIKAPAAMIRTRSRPRARRPPTPVITPGATRRAARRW